MVVAAVVLLVGTVLVFRVFDVHSHSASDTLRSFLLTMVPVSVVCIAAARVFFSAGTRQERSPGRVLGNVL
jgi:hypothetical protein